MMRRSRAAALALALAVALALATPAAAGNDKRSKEGKRTRQRGDGCGVPEVEGLDQSPSDPATYGQCTSELDAHVAGVSNWCSFNSLGYWPGGPSRKAAQCHKFGRMTVYRGPVYGSEPGHKGACNVDLAGSDEAALVAVSTKYLKTEQHGWAADKGACGACMCVHLRGVDDKYNPGVRYANAKKYFGLTFLGKVGDRCGECEDDHIDVLMDRPVAYAPYSPSEPTENRFAPHANSRTGPRGFGDPRTIHGGDSSPETVGTWVADWNWVPCDGWSHKRCADLMKKSYSGVFPPRMTPGVDSTTLRRAKVTIGGEPWAEAVQRPAHTGPRPAAAAEAMCGGRGAGCTKVDADGQCEDKQWADCPVGFSCARDSEWWWACVPEEPAKSR